MVSEKISKVTIRLEENDISVLQRALNILQNINNEINNPDVDEIEFYYERDKGIMRKMFDELEDITSTYWEWPDGSWVFFCG